MTHSFLTMSMTDVIRHREQQAEALRKKRRIRSETIEEFKTRLKRKFTGKGNRK